jgi:hypothetical protein
MVFEPNSFHTILEDMNDSKFLCVCVSVFKIHFGILYNCMNSLSSLYLSLLYARTCQFRYESKCILYIQSRFALHRWERD